MWMICPVCKLKIGGLDHILFKREGHFRLFLNENQRAQVNPNFDYKLLSEFKAMVNEKKKNSKELRKLIMNFLKNKIKI